MAHSYVLFSSIHWATKLRFLPNDIFSIHFHERSNVSIMAGDRDPMAIKPDRIALSDVENSIK